MSTASFRVNLKFLLVIQFRTVNPFIVSSKLQSAVVHKRGETSIQLEIQFYNILTARLENMYIRNPIAEFFFNFTP